MSKMGEKVAYLKGLAQGLGVDAQSEQGKLMLAMIDTLEVFAQHNEELEERLAELSEYVEEIDSDVSDLEEALFSEEEEDFDEDADDEEDDEDGNTDGMIEYECPHCGTVIFFDEDAFDMEEEHLCPNCHRKVFEEDEDPGEDGE
ncbi:MAG TPA: zinc ribbon domain-containing protein [Candidatus Ventricola gallistercoris]|nr:zinc ribbon domain-containing protein [Candidatus Ventricola gallistercoris]